MTKRTLAPLRDSDIRLPLHRWLGRAHSRSLDTHIIHELKIPRPSARIDVAVVNGELCGFEIKSDVDSLVRLPRQARAFSTVFDRVTIVTTSRHSEAIYKAVPDWWGIVTVLRRGANASFVPKRTAKTNPNPNTDALLHMLSRKELVQLLEANELAAGLRSKRRVRLVEAALANLPIDKITSEVRRLFKIRAVRHRPHN